LTVLNKEHFSQGFGLFGVVFTCNGLEYSAGDLGFIFPFIFLLFYCFALNWSYRRKAVSLWLSCHNLRPCCTTCGWIWREHPLGEEPVEIVLNLFI